MRVAIIGAGPAGLAAGEVLSRRDVQVEVFEASDTVGGMARSFALWGQTVDLGPHRFFSQDPTVNQFWLDVVGADVRMVDRLTRIFYRDRFFRYPLEARNALWNLGAFEAARCVGSYLAQKVTPGLSDGLEGTFEGWVVERFGRRLFEIFFQAYSEKLWGISCRDLDADFAAQRIKKFSLAAAIWSALGLGGGLHATLVDRFAYPTGGSGLVYERLAAHPRARRPCRDASAGPRPCPRSWRCPWSALRQRRDPLLRPCHLDHAPDPTRLESRPTASLGRGGGRTVAVPQHDPRLPERGCPRPVPRPVALCAFARAAHRPGDQLPQLGARVVR